MPSAKQLQNRATLDEALRSSRFTQGPRYLRHNDRHCCLGVACEVVGKLVPLKDDEEVGDEVYWNYDFGEEFIGREDELIPNNLFAEWFGVDENEAHEIQHNVSTANDVPLSFSAIAQMFQEAFAACDAGKYFRLRRL